jgi:hypothetical protein
LGGHPLQQEHWRWWRAIKQIVEVYSVRCCLDRMDVPLIAVLLIFTTRFAKFMAVSAYFFNVQTVAPTGLRLDSAVSF